MTLPAQPNTKKYGGSANKSFVNEDIVLIEVDDILEGGSPSHRVKIESLYQRWKCGTCKNLKKDGKVGTRVTGIRVIQNMGYTEVGLQF